MGHGGFAPRGWGTPQQGRGPRCTPQSSQCWKSPQLTRRGAAKTFTPWRQSPPYEPFQGQPLRDGARRAPRDPIAGLWRGSGAAKPVLQIPRDPTAPRVEGEAGARRRQELPGHVRGGEMRQTRGRRAGDGLLETHRGFGNTRPPAPGWRGCPDPPPLAPSWPLTSSCRGSSPLGVWSWHMLGWAPPQPKC